MRWKYIGLLANQPGMKNNGSPAPVSQYTKFKRSLMLKLLILRSGKSEAQMAGQ